MKVLVWVSLTVGSTPNLLHFCWYHNQPERTSLDLLMKTTHYMKQTLFLSLVTFANDCDQVQMGGGYVT